MAEKKYYIQVDALKGLAIFLVILGHSIIVHPIDLRQNEICAALARIVCSAHMPLFFLISGYCFSYKEKYKNFILKKVKRLIIPYICFNLLDMVPRALLSSLVNRPRGIGESVIDILFCGGEYWFIYALFVIFAVYPIVYKLQMKHKAFMIATELLLLALAFVGIDTPLFTLDSICKYLFFFNTGMILKHSKLNLFDIKLSPALVACFLSATVLWLVTLFLPFHTYLVPLTASFGIVAYYFLCSFDVFNKAFAPFGKYSLQLYLFNGFLLVISRTLICKLTENPFIIITFNTAVCFLISYVLIRYVFARIPIVRNLMGIV